MPNRCCVPRCVTNCKNASSDDKVSLFRFPSEDQTLLSKWIKSVPREWNDKSIELLTKNEKNSIRICSLHFRESDIVTESDDTNDHRKNKRTTNKLIRHRLLEDACP